MRKLAFVGIALIFPLIVLTKIDKASASPGIEVTITPIDPLSLP